MMKGIFLVFLNTCQPFNIDFNFNTPIELYSYLDNVMYKGYQKKILDLMDIQKNSLILDVGAGMGYQDIAMVQSVNDF